LSTRSTLALGKGKLDVDVDEAPALEAAEGAAEALPAAPLSSVISGRHAGRTEMPTTMAPKAWRVRMERLLSKARTEPADQRVASRLSQTQLPLAQKLTERVPSTVLGYHFELVMGLSAAE
jgi:hypothetical protein